MSNIEKVIKAIDICLGHGKCNDCSYHSGANYSDQNCRGRMLQDVLAILKELNGLFLALEQSNNVNEYLNNEVERLNGLLKERKTETGHWIYKKYDDMFMCSCCEKYSIRNDYPYCHWCGTKMESR